MALHGRIPFPPEFFGSNVPLGSRWVRAAGGSIEERQNESDTLEVFGSGGSGGMIRFFSEDPGRSLVSKDKLVSWKHFGRFMQSFKLMSFCNFRELKRSKWNLIGFPGSRLRFSAQIKQRQNKLSPNCVSNQIINQIWSFAETIWAKDSILL